MNALLWKARQRWGGRQRSVPEPPGTEAEAGFKSPDAGLASPSLSETMPSHAEIPTRFAVEAGKVPAAIRCLLLLDKKCASPRSQQPPRRELDMRQMLLKYVTWKPHAENPAVQPAVTSMKLALQATLSL